MSNNDFLNICQLSDLIKKSLPREYIRLTAEVRQPKISRGHMYLNLKDNGGIINSAIWKYNITPQIENLKDGDKISVEGKLDFYDGNGKLSFIINKLVSVEGEGELNILYRKMKNAFEKKGYFLEDNKLRVAKVIKKILILTSKNGDAIKDFYHCVEHNNLNLDDDFINVSVQGNDCPNSICKIINSDEIYQNNYDMIVITRGGGSFEDLFGFCQKELIESVYKCKIPILSAVGHKQDTTLLDYVADYVAPTPSLAAQFIVDHNKKYTDKLIFIKDNMKNELSDYIHKELNKIYLCERKLIEQKSEYQNFLEKIKNNIIFDLNNSIMNLDKLDNKYQMTNNIKLFSNENEINEYNSLIEILNKKDDLFIVINGKIINVKNFYV